MEKVQTTVSEVTLGRPRGTERTVVTEKTGRALERPRGSE